MSEEITFNEQNELVQLNADIYVYCSGIRHLFEITDNLINIKSHIEKFGITEENKELFASSFESLGVDYSVEGVGTTIINAIKKVISKIVGFIKTAFTKLFELISTGWKKLMKLFKSHDKPLPKEQIEHFNKLLSGSSSNEGFGAVFEGVAEGNEFGNDKFIAKLKQDTEGTFVRNKEGKFANINSMHRFITMYGDYVMACMSAIIRKETEPHLPKWECTYTDAYAAGWSDVNNLDRLNNLLIQTIEKFGEYKYKLNTLISQNEKIESSKEYLEQLKHSLQSLQLSANMFAKISNACKAAISAKTKCLKQYYLNASLSGTAPLDPYWGRDTELDIPTFTI